MLYNSVRIILDTNLWISFLIKNDFYKIDALLHSGLITLIFSEKLLLEFIHVSQQKKFEKYFSNFDILIVMSAIDRYAEFVKVNTEITLCRDIKDNFLLSLAVDSKADYLISGDNDLLELKKIEKTKIITMTDFFHLHNL